MAAVIHDQPREIDRRLAQYFNSTRDQWLDVIKAIVAARGACTDNNAKSAPGFHAWDAGVKRMREIFRREGWEKGDEDGVETIVHNELKKKVTVLNTDCGTADKVRSPRNRTPKGPANEKLIDLNDQMEMFKRREIAAPPKNQNAMWYLCVYDDGMTVRAELSRPIKFTSSHFVAFSERIFLLQGDDWKKITTAAMPPASEIDHDYKIDVRRK
ncbi:MAG: hypothetical protein QOG66_2595 [Methylobacteriaceae bacterium]|jgi:hypothetical protein|nr:hypothetical protein [Methylobacteriaceae bacterium]